MTDRRAWIEHALDFLVATIPSIVTKTEIGFGHTDAIAGSQPEIPVVVGSTGAGKTDLVLELAAALRDVEIISADAFQVYRGMDIGTAKSTVEERSRVPHHLVDIVEPVESYSAGRFVTDAEAAIADVLVRGGVPVVAGGGMMYLWALAEGLHSGPPQDEALRSAGLSRTELIERLAAIDAEASKDLAAAPAPRIIRAIEIVEDTGSPLKKWSSAEKNAPRFRYRFFKLLPPRNELYVAINRRVESMLAAGLIDEVAALRERGVTAAMKSQRAIGYREVHDYLDGRLGMEELTPLIQRNTRRYAKRQVTWLRHHF